MNFWLLLIFSLFTQESATFTTSLYLALQNHTNILVIHLLFIIFTIFDIWVGYYLGSYLDRRFLHGSRFQKWVKNHSGFLDKPGRNYILIFTGVIDFPFLNGIIGSWVELPLKTTIITTFIGSSISYIIYWGLALGVINLHLNKFLEISIAVLLAIGLIYTLQKIFEKKTGN